MHEFYWQTATEQKWGSELEAGLIQLLPLVFSVKNHEAAYIERAGEDAKLSGSQLTIGK